MDNKSLSGEEVYILSFGGNAEVNFYNQEDNRRYTLNVPPRSLYRIAKEARYEFLHSVKNGEKDRYVLIFCPPDPLNMSFQIDLNEKKIVDTIPIRVCEENLTKIMRPAEIQKARFTNVQQENK